MASKVALVTGASSGIGEAVARQLHDAGFTVYAAARRVDRMQGLRAAGIRPIALDVTDDSSAQDAVAQIIAEQGRVDVLVNNAGYGSYGALEDVPLTEAQAQLDVNVLGLARLARLVLPPMRAQRSGTIINVSSMGGNFTTPLGAWYHASKYAVEAISDAMRMELAPFGIQVVVIQPGAIRTEWGAIAAEKVLETSGDGVYRSQAEGVAKTLGDSSLPDAGRTSSPDVVAQAIVKAATARRPRTRYRIGFGAKPLVFVKRVLPDRAFDWLIKRGTGVRS
ncbi:MULTISPECIES: oxidoreductase [unclassified Microbacterium]|uniref:oxidoreductase n=1 Tax=unclassified Microbacterium TaxID=2609290 RepID=UPI0012F72CA1|nr:oxidoreductase [Microbacterium sp. MAH-37]MVQ43879.1 SDR family NAD(P)-dependent oxidoreductase [Microbacterium sp. MAH-37]